MPDGHDRQSDYRRLGGKENPTKIIAKDFAVVRG